MPFCNPGPSIMSRSFLNSGTLIVKIQRKPREISQFGKKSAKVYHSLYSSTEELQVALWTYMFFKLGLNKEKSLHILSLHSLPLLCISPSIIPQKKIMSRSFLNSGTLLVIISFCRILFQKSGTKSRGVLHFVPLRRFYSVLFIPLFCRP